MIDTVHYDEATIPKVLGILRDAGLSGEQALDATVAMHDAGILFRERLPEVDYRPNRCGAEVSEASRRYKKIVTCRNIVTEAGTLCWNHRPGHATTPRAKAREVVVDSTWINKKSGHISIVEEVFTAGPLRGRARLRVLGHGRPARDIQITSLIGNYRKEGVAS